MYIHMEDRQTIVLIPRNRYDDVIKAINNSSDHILAFGGNFSKAADGHLVCMQNTKDEHSEMYSYSTQAINIQGQPRKGREFNKVPLCFNLYHNFIVDFSYWCKLFCAK